MLAIKTVSIPLKDFEAFIEEYLFQLQLIEWNSGIDILSYEASHNLDSGVTNSEDITIDVTYREVPGD